MENLHTYTFRMVQLWMKVVIIKGKVMEGSILFSLKGPERMGGGGEFT